MTTADRGVLDRLLALQDEDLQLDQLDHRLATLPERVQLAEIDQQVDVGRRDQAGIRDERDRLAKSQRRLEDEVASIGERIDRENAKLYSGSVVAHRELQAIQDEIASLKRRTASLEDQVLELMEQIEPLDEQLRALAGRDQHLSEQRADIEIRLEDATSAIDAERIAVVDRRAAVLGSITDTALLDEYARLRPALGGVAAARLTGSTCGGCHLALSAVEIDRLKHAPPGTVEHCEECGRILVP